MEIIRRNILFLLFLILIFLLGILTVVYFKKNSKSIAIMKKIIELSKDKDINNIRLTDEKRMGDYKAVLTFKIDYVDSIFNRTKYLYVYKSGICFYQSEKDKNGKNENKTYYAVYDDSMIDSKMLINRKYEINVLRDLNRDDIESLIEKKWKKINFLVSNCHLRNPEAVYLIDHMGNKLGHLKKEGIFEPFDYKQTVHYDLFEDILIVPGHSIKH